MPLPEKVFEYLPYAFLALKNRGGLIHYYNFEHAVKAENAIEKVKAKVTEKIEEMGITSKHLIVGLCVQPDRTCIEWLLIFY